jgi:hypothetical protein
LFVFLAPFFTTSLAGEQSAPSIVAGTPAPSARPAREQHAPLVFGASIRRLPALSQLHEIRANTGGCRDRNAARREHSGSSINIAAVDGAQLAEHDFSWHKRVWSVN